MTFVIFVVLVNIISCVDYVRIDDFDNYCVGEHEKTVFVEDGACFGIQEGKGSNKFVIAGDLVIEWEWEDDVMNCTGDGSVDDVYTDGVCYGSDTVSARTTTDYWNPNFEYVCTLYDISCTTEVGKLYTGDDLCEHDDNITAIQCGVPVVCGDEVVLYMSCEDFIPTPSSQYVRLDVYSEGTEGCRDRDIELTAYIEDGACFSMYYPGTGGGSRWIIGELDGVSEWRFDDDHCSGTAELGVDLYDDEELADCYNDSMSVSVCDTGSYDGDDIDYDYECVMYDAGCETEVGMMYVKGDSYCEEGSMKNVECGEVNDCGGDIMFITCDVYTPPPDDDAFNDEAFALSVDFLLF